MSARKPTDRSYFHPREEDVPIATTQEKAELSVRDDINTHIRYANVSDLEWVNEEEIKNYGEDGWHYSKEEWIREIKKRDYVKDKNVIHIYGDDKKSYIQLTEFPQRGLYITTVGGDIHAIDKLMKWVLSKNYKRCYTHVDPKWVQNNLDEMLISHGFVNIGFGDNLKEVGKWAMDLSKLYEYDVILPSPALLPPCRYLN